MEQEKRRLSWHPAFGAVLRIELEKELDLLEIVDERQLTKEPLQMDVLVVKKEKDIRLEKNIGRIFKSYNIIEYKSPEDYLSINDFYKVYAYACLYQSDTDRVMEVDPKGDHPDLCVHALPQEAAWAPEGDERDDGSAGRGTEFTILRETPLRCSFWSQGSFRRGTITGCST